MATRDPDRTAKAVLDDRDANDKSPGGRRPRLRPGARLPDSPAGAPETGAAALLPWYLAGETSCLPVHHARLTLHSTHSDTSPCREPELPRQRLVREKATSALVPGRRSVGFVPEPLREIFVAAVAEDDDN